MTARKSAPLTDPAAAAIEVLARLDERLARSPVRDGWIERQHFADATAALWLEGELVHLEIWCTMRIWISACRRTS